MFCNTCGAEQSNDSLRCSQCGNNPSARPSTSSEQERSVYTPTQRMKKSRIWAGILQILLSFIGIGGIGRLYLGYVGIGLMQLLTGPIGAIGLVWSIIDGILILTGRPALDAYDNPLD